MHDILKRVACAAGLLILSFAAAKANPSIVIDANTGQVISADDATRPWVPASTTKMMTAYVALKAIRDGRARLDSPLQVSALASRQRPVKLYLKPGQLITLDNALKIMLVKSANDLAYVVAEGIGGSVENFSAMMNAEARRLGMTESHFVNPNGWDASGHQSSARDLAILARAILRDFPSYEGYFGIGAVALGNKVIKNTNGLIGRYPGAMGMKTGFVCASGFNVVAVADRGGRRLIAVVMGALSGSERTVKAAQLLDAGFASYGNLGTPEMLPASGYQSAPNICTELRRRGAPLSDDYESDAAIVSQGQHFEQDGQNPAYAMFQTPAAQGKSGMTQRENGRIVLGPRAEFDPVPVYLGPAPGSNAPVLMARSMSPLAPAAVIPASAMALAPTSSAAASRVAPSAPGQIAPLNNPSTGSGAVQQDADDEVGAPLSLASVPPKPGAILPPAKGKAFAIRGAAQPTSASVIGGKKAAAKAEPKAKQPVMAAKLAKEPAKTTAKAKPKAKKADEE